MPGASRAQLARANFGASVSLCKSAPVRPPREQVPGTGPCAEQRQDGLASTTTGCSDAVGGRGSGSPAATHACARSSLSWARATQTAGSWRRPSNGEGGGKVQGDLQVRGDRCWTQTNPRSLKTLGLTHVFIYKGRLCRGRGPRYNGNSNRARQARRHPRRHSREQRWCWRGLAPTGPGWVVHRQPQGRDRWHRIS